MTHSTYSPHRTETILFQPPQRDSEWAGEVKAKQESYGVEIEVCTPDGTKYLLLIDLCKAKAAADTQAVFYAYPDGETPVRLEVPQVKE